MTIFGIILDRNKIQICGFHRLRDKMKLHRPLKLDSSEKFSQGHLSDFFLNAGVLIGLKSGFFVKKSEKKSIFHQKFAENT